MVPFDDKSPFVTSGIRVRLHPRGLVGRYGNYCSLNWQSIARSYKEVIEAVANEVNEMMSERAIFVY
jgi:glycine hydroxymethyltransferase